MSSVDPATLEAIAGGLRRRGWFVVHDAVPAAVVEGLRAAFERDPAAFERAGVGRDDDFRHVPDVRRDRIRWLDPEDAAGSWYFAWIESLRLGLNRSLFLGLFDYECHLAWYEPGAFYAAHLDAFRGEDNRKVSTVLYLNDAWSPSDGGELVLFRPGDPDDPAEQPLTVAAVVEPTSATLVCFLSEEIPHEVLPARADRLSVAGWFRVNRTTDRVDPPLLAAVR